VGVTGTALNRRDVVQTVHAAVYCGDIGAVLQSETALIGSTFEFRTGGPPTRITSNMGLRAEAIP
jgi:hypothetical protein